MGPCPGHVRRRAHGAPPEDGRDRFHLPPRLT